MNSVGPIELVPGEADALRALLAARDQTDYGEADFSAPILEDSLRMATFDVGRDAVLATRDGHALGGALLIAPGALAFVDPEAEGQGAGAALLGWLIARGERDGRSVHRQRVSAANTAARALLEAAGYRRVRQMLHMTVDLATLPPVAPLPPGVTLRALDRERDARALHDADQRMFADNDDYEPMPFEVFCEVQLASPDLAPELSPLAWRGDHLAAFALCRRLDEHAVGFVDLLAVDGTERRHGLGRALLLEALARCAADGQHEGRLDVASDNAPALALYGAVGMRAARATDILERPLTRG